ncbi:anti-sigma factor [Nocardiopsis ansamitocini]|uniref:anti-sigma factor n=1 Tax=Nocardiopsis ansamitocini TaxID=1670832 RepID=UPI002557BE4E|nr:anti-sigma factor [Nocardiopsis ansamitocini]
MSRKLRQDLHTLAGAYALNALGGDELHRFEGHLLQCESCVQEVRGLSETTALLGAAAALTPPPAMRERVLSEVSRTRQLAPAPIQLSSPAGGWGRRWSFLALAACLVLALALGGVAVNQQIQLDQARQHDQAIAQVLAASDATYVSGDAGDGVHATVVASESAGGLVFTASGLAPLEGKDYQLWLADPDGAMRSGGVVPIGSDGIPQPLLASGLDEANGVAVTIEPEGGSDQPTSSPIMAMDFEG